MNYLSLDEAKAAFGVSTFQIVKNDNTGKISILLPTGKFLKVQQNLDKTKEIAFMFEDDLDEGCLINVDRKSPLNDFLSL